MENKRENGEQAYAVLPAGAKVVPISSKMTTNCIVLIKLATVASHFFSSSRLAFLNKVQSLR